MMCPSVSILYSKFLSLSASPAVKWKCPQQKHILPFVSFTFVNLKSPSQFLFFQFQGPICQYLVSLVCFQRHVKGQDPRSLQIEEKNVFLRLLFHYPKVSSIESLTFWLTILCGHIAKETDLSAPCSSMWNGIQVVYWARMGNLYFNKFSFSL